MLKAEGLRSTEALTRWAADRAVPRGRLDRIYSALELSGCLPEEAGPLQEPAVFVPGLKSTPWHDPADHPWTAAFETRYPEIRDEFSRLFSGEGLGIHPESEGLAESGRWSTYHFYRMGQKFEEHLEECPQLADVLTQVPGIESAGMCYFSVMGGKTKVKPHCGFVNTRIRCHLGLIVPDGCEMRVGAGTRTWEEGKCLVFDDSYEHEVTNRSDHSRAVLLLDTWHPDLSEAERQALAFLMRSWSDLVD